MDLNRLTRDADDLIRKVVSRYNQLYVPAGSISQVELDLMLDDLRKLYDTFKTIVQINLTLQNSLVKPEVKVNTAIPEEPQDVAAEASSGNFINTPEPTSAPPRSQSEPEPKTETKPEPEPELKSEPQPAIILPDEAEEELIAESGPEPVQENEVHSVPGTYEKELPAKDETEIGNQVNTEVAPAMLADKFSSGNKSLSETIASSQEQAGLGTRLQFQPIADLSTGIGLNDKFSFISDLFGNNTVLYDEAITRINKAVNLDEANWILQKYHAAEWDQKQDSLSRLKDFVKRRFI